MTFDDFDMTITCEEVYNEDGYNRCEEASAEMEPF